MKLEEKFETDLLANIENFVFNKTGKQIKLKYDSEYGSCVAWRVDNIPIPTCECGLMGMALESVAMDVSLTYFPDEEDEYLGEARVKVQFWHKRIGGGSNGLGTTFIFKVNGLMSIDLVNTGQNGN